MRGKCCLRPQNSACGKRVLCRTKAGHGNFSPTQKHKTARRLACNRHIARTAARQNDISCRGTIRHGLPKYATGQTYIACHAGPGIAFSLRRQIQLKHAAGWGYHELDSDCDMPPDGQPARAIAGNGCFCQARGCDIKHIDCCSPNGQTRDRRPRRAKARLRRCGNLPAGFSRAAELNRTGYIRKSAELHPRLCIKRHGPNNAG